MGFPGPTGPVCHAHYAVQRASPAEFMKLETGAGCPGADERPIPHA